MKNKHSISATQKKFAIPVIAAIALLLITLSAVYLRNNAESNKTVNDIAEVLRWDDRTITEKYPSIV